MPDLPISYFPIVERQQGSADLQKLFVGLESTLGFVPNVIRAFAWREPRFWKWWAHRNDLMAPSEGLSKADRDKLESACWPEYLRNGPAAYNSCLAGKLAETKAR